MSPRYYNKPLVKTTARLTIPTTVPYQKSIVFGRINSNFTKSELLDYFFQFGNILKVNIEFNQLDQEFKGLGFVTVGDDATFRKILTSVHYFKGQLLSVDKVNPRHIPIPMFSEDLRVKVTGIPDMISKGEFQKKLYAVVEGVKKIDFVTKPVSLVPMGHAFLHFDSIDFLEQCLKSHKNVTLEFRGEHVQLSLSEAPKVCEKIREINHFNTNVKEFKPKNLPVTCQPPMHMKILKQRD